MTKSWRLVKLAEPVFAEMGFAVEILDLSQLTSEFGKQIHPCKSCVSTAVALYHWPCSCYRPDRRLDERNLSLVGRRPWHSDRSAGELVSGAVGAEGDDRPSGLRGRL
jgi:hypothetical protein